MGSNAQKNVCSNIRSNESFKSKKSVCSKFSFGNDGMRSAKFLSGIEEMSAI